jgi:hypothetical protein
MSSSQLRRWGIEEKLRILNEARPAHYSVSDRFLRGDFRRGGVG